jgi:hypothetical protein
MIVGAELNRPAEKTNFALLLRGLYEGQPPQYQRRGLSVKIETCPSRWTGLCYRPGNDEEAELQCLHRTSDSDSR